MLEDYKWCQHESLVDTDTLELFMHQCIDRRDYLLEALAKSDGDDQVSDAILRGQIQELWNWLHLSELIDNEHSDVIDSLIKEQSNGSRRTRWLERIRLR